MRGKSSKKRWNYALPFLPKNIYSDWVKTIKWANKTERVCIMKRVNIVSFASPFLILPFMYMVAVPVAFAGKSTMEIQDRQQMM